jgi:hypothetical protein
MNLAGGALLVATVASVFLLSIGAAAGDEGGNDEPARGITDGRLRPGHLETIRVKGFPGKGVVDIAFFPTAICEDECGARFFRGGRTDEQGTASFRVRMPGTFFDYRDRPVYFRDGERIDVSVTWEGAGRSFDVASVEPEPILVRSHRGSQRG